MPEVYLINGFLEAGKTTFINELLAKDYFKIKGKLNNPKFRLYPFMWGVIINIYKGNKGVSSKVMERPFFVLGGSKPGGGYYGSF